jgi:hypothetical protein
MKSIKLAAITGAFALCAALSACGGGGAAEQAASAISTPAQADSQPAGPMAVNLKYRATTVDSGIYSSGGEMTTQLPLTTGSPYNFASVYSVTIPNVVDSDVIHCDVQAEITSNYDFEVQIDRAFAIGTTNEAWPEQVQPIRGTNVTLSMHHMAIDSSFNIKHHTGAVTIAFDLSAASTAGLQGQAVTVEQGYGGMQCYILVIKQ